MVIFTQMGARARDTKFRNSLYGDMVSLFYAGRDEVRFLPLQKRIRRSSPVIVTAPECSSPF